MKDNNDLDLSYLKKEDNLENTTSFIDLMSRGERTERNSRNFISRRKRKS